MRFTCLVLHAWIAVLKLKAMSVQTPYDTRLMRGMAITPSGLIGNLSFAPKPACNSSFVAEGDWCEEICVWWHESELMKKAKMSRGHCTLEGFLMEKGDVNVSIFVSSDDPFPQSSDVFSPPSDCNAHSVVKEELCEHFCVGTDVRRKEWAEQRTGVLNQTCVERGFSKFVGDSTLLLYTI
mmetsp:Transcript_86701/g.136782  ORF Transcript_86701/g.136782 Transcript_86701/m.136782 type:complete len:181 (+) Transcript_86701:88-630(+)